MSYGVLNCRRMANPNTPDFFRNFCRPASSKQTGLDEIEAFFTIIPDFHSNPAK